jgi:AbrB family looped-hinge helix DNA binding protein
MASSTVTSKGQITIPADMREALGLRPGDRVGFHLEKDGRIRVFKVESITDATAGSMRQYATLPAPSAKELRETAEEAIAEEASERGARPRRDLAAS